VNVQCSASRQDRIGSATTMGSGSACWIFKLSTADTQNGLFVVENTFHEKGGPARHLHHEQDEWVYALEGEFTFEIGQQGFTLKPGDSVLGPRRVPHVWAYTGGGTGRILVAFTPAARWRRSFGRSRRRMRCPRRIRRCGERTGWSLSGHRSLRSLPAAQAELVVGSVLRKLYVIPELTPDRQVSNERYGHKLRDLVSQE
jgi:quercetin dioxygenase-like cupin family protein